MCLSARRRGFDDGQIVETTILKKRPFSQHTECLVPVSCRSHLLEMSTSTATTASHASHEDKGWIVLALGWSQTGIAAVVVILRFYTRYMMRGIVIEDWLMLIALVSLLDSTSDIE